MHCVFQRFWHTNVRLEEEELLAESTYIGTDKEACARMIIDPGSLVVRKAWWEIYRAPGLDSPRMIEAPGLEGMTAYFDCGDTLREALLSPGLTGARDLFAESVRGIIQAETFLLEQRGYSSPLEYQNYWANVYQGACRYYSNMERVKQRWYEHIGYSERSGSLFNRMKSQALHLDNKKILLSGHLHDSFHSVAAVLELDQEDGRITNSRGDILLAPDLVCTEAAVYMADMEGLLLPQMGKKEIAALLGAENGCVHLIDLVSDGAETVLLYRENESSPAGQ